MSKTGEIISASTAEFTAQCYELHQAPPLGSLIKTREGSLEIYGIVCNALTHSIEPGRRPTPRGQTEDREEDIFSSNPQLAKLLCTEFTNLVVGHRDNTTVYHYLPPRPARIHNFAYLCTQDEVLEFSQSLDFLSILVSTKFPGAVDEMIAACLRYIGQIHPDRREFLIRAGKELTVLLSNEMNRLNAILRRIRA